MIYVPIECPSCHQGNVAAYRVKSTGETIQLCDECEGLWGCAVEPGPSNFDTLQAYMGRRGIPGLWDRHEEVE